MNVTTLKALFRKSLSTIGLYKTLATAYRSLSPGRRRLERALADDIASRITPLGRAPEAALRAYSGNRTALVIGQAAVDDVLLQFPLIAALRVSGHEVIVIFQVPSPTIERLYRSLGVSGFTYSHRYLRARPHPEAAASLASIRDSGELLAFRWLNGASGKYAAATWMRQSRKGDIDLGDERCRGGLQTFLSNSMNAVEAMTRLVADVRPDVVCFFDRGYTPDGELFDAALAGGAHALTMNAGHKSGLLMLKRYDQFNRDAHPASLSVTTWETIREMPWSAVEDEAVEKEMASCYQDGSWYDEVGTQFGKNFVKNDEVASSLGLDSRKKVAAIFPHLFWDATFFWGEDLFTNYEVWFKETLRAAMANESLNWIVKIHPANLIKDARDSHHGEHSEMLAIRELASELPNHVKIIPADSSLSTYSLLQLIDYCVTVRGTVGLESACHGVPVITAGTGRYDRKGFTIDPNDAGEYLNKLATLEQLEPLDAHQTELARRYAWGVLFARPLKTESVNFGYHRDAGATLRVDLSPSAGVDPAKCLDVDALSEWLKSGAYDFLSRNTMGKSVVVPDAPAMDGAVGR